MGRVKIQMRKIEDRQQRNIAFAKRKSGLLKKAYELYTLCDIQIALVLFSPSGKLFLFDAKKRIEETIHEYLELPCYRRGRCFLKNPNHWESMDEIDNQEKLLQRTLDQVRSRKQNLEVESKLFDVLNWPLQPNLEISSME
ncbi:unnamed protein product [Thlaspi arvense]|uniref:MADS-box domain-containing protein n=1 Tax=Thlaspi arvense TaxID=13288 RepID=A0AAU9SXU0_THLAR|nr:unnamed protein product [Thlaspi arvense]